MTAITNTEQTYQAVGIREDLSDLIYNISPTDTPYWSNIKKLKAANSYFEWQIDSLASADTTNAQIEGDDITSFEAVTPTTRIGNYTQISRKDVVISGTLEVVNKAGRKSELAYEMAKKSKELKRDLEAITLTNQAATAGSSSSARKTGSVLAFLKTNVVKASDGANPTYTNIPTSTRTDGTAATFTETMLKSAMSLAFTSGAKPTMLMVGTFNKGTVSAFSGVATKTFYQSAVEQTAIIGAADVYVSDFGILSVVPNRFQRGRDAHLVDPDYAGIAFLRPFTTEPLAKTGDAEKRLLIVEWGLEIMNEQAQALVADLTTS